MNAPEKEILTLRGFVLGFDGVLVCDEVHLFGQIKRALRNLGSRLLCVVNMTTALLNISLSLNGSRPKRCRF